MTFSIVVRDDDTWGVAVASKFLSVGAFVPAARPGVGALATQADVNLRYREDGLDLLASGHDATDTVRSVVAADPRGSHRQLGVVDARGGSAAHTGDDCIGWAGHRTGDGYAVQGNCLVGAEVLLEVERSWRQGHGTVADRLVAALLAGDLTGGDARGRQSAAVLVVRERGGFMEATDVVVDLRVDDHPAPAEELVRLAGLHRLSLQRPTPDELVVLDPALRAELDDLARGLGHADLEEWVGTYNYEMRLVAAEAGDPTGVDRLDAAVVEMLRGQAAGTTR